MYAYGEMSSTEETLEPPSPNFPVNPPLIKFSG
jgi:hypothetical protein